MHQAHIKFLRQNYNVYTGDASFESVRNEIFKYREYRSAESYIVGAKNLIIDAGAHIGLFTLYCRALNRNAKIISLEPEPNNFKILRNNIRLNHITGVSPVNSALSFASGSDNLIICEDSSLNHRLLFEEKNNGNKIIKVTTVTLDDLLEDAKENITDFIKMDIEGAENRIILNWTAQTLGKIASLMVEYHNSHKYSHKTLETKLRESGFGVNVYPSKFEANMGFILAHNKKIRKKNYDE